MAKVGRIYELPWPDDHPVMPGVVVRIRGLSIRRFLDVQQLAQRVQQRGAGAQEQIEAALEAVQQLAGVVAGAIVSWNLEYDDTTDADGNVVPGGPVPTDTDGVLSLDPEAFTALVEEWLDAVAGVPAPLPGTSGDGLPSEELSMPMEPLSASLAS